MCDSVQLHVQSSGTALPVNTNGIDNANYSKFVELSKESNGKNFVVLGTQAHEHPPAKSWRSTSRHENVAFVTNEAINNQVNLCLFRTRMDFKR